MLPGHAWNCSCDLCHHLLLRYLDQHIRRGLERYRRQPRVQQRICPLLPVLSLIRQKLWLQRLHREAA